MKIEIFEEDSDNTLSFEDKYANFTIDVYSESKTYQSRMSLKDDVYYRTEQFEYRIKTDPIKVETRLTERVDEPPERYAVKDGVVLESGILADRKETASMSSMTKEFIDNLKKEIEWHEEWVGNPVSIYILSKHPEIISPDDYRHYLRQLAEKIKTATLKIEKVLASDPTGLKITDEYEDSGRLIWYPKAKLDAMPDDGVKKIREHQKKIQEKFFDKKSKEYVGISESEFRSSKDILENIETFLNKKPSPVKKEDQKVSFGVKLGAFILQWIWLFIVMSIVLWLLSLIVSIIQYSFFFAFFASGVLAFFYTLLRNKQATNRF